MPTRPAAFLAALLLAACAMPVDSEGSGDVTGEAEEALGGSCRLVAIEGICKAWAKTEVACGAPGTMAQHVSDCLVSWKVEKQQGMGDFYASWIDCTAKAHASSCDPSASLACSAAAKGATSCPY